MARQRRFVALALALVASTDALDTIRSHLRKVPEATATADGAEFKGLVEEVRPDACTYGFADGF